ITDRPDQSLLERHLRRPSQALASDADVGPALARVVRGQGPAHDLRGGGRELEYRARELEHRGLDRISQVDRPGEARLRIHHGDAAADQVVDVAEAAGLAAV